MRSCWQITRDVLKKELPEKNFETWIKPVEFHRFENDKLELKVPNKFYKDWLNEHYRDFILNELKKYSNLSQLKLDFVYSEDQKHAATPNNDGTSPYQLSNAMELIPLTRNFSQQQLNPLFDKYRFDTFVIGPSNQFACAACRAVANNPGTVYNPLFIYGGAGLGKTHLLIAVKNVLLAAGSNARVIYRTSEKFTNEWIASIQKGKTEEFRAKYRDNCDILLIDDIQFLAGKEQTQVEFFHTFNTLYSAKKQIVVTSDRYPKDIGFLDERLRSRLEWGLVCDIQPPEMETRVAILKRKAEQDGFNLQDDVAIFLATNLKNNVRLLEGSLTKLAAFSSLTGQEINIELAKDLFKSFMSEEKPITVDRIQDAVSNFFNIKTHDLKSANRQRIFAFPRQIAMYLARKLTKSSFPEIGMKFGGKDHSTVVHAAQKIDSMVKTDPSLKVTIDSIEKTILLRN